VAFCGCWHRAATRFALQLGSGAEDEFAPDDLQVDADPLIPPPLAETRDDFEAPAAL